MCVLQSVPRIQQQQQTQTQHIIMVYINICIKVGQIVPKRIAIRKEYNLNLRKIFQENPRSKMSFKIAKNFFHT